MRVSGTGNWIFIGLGNLEIAMLESIIKDYQRQVGKTVDRYTRWHLLWIVVIDLLFLAYLFFIGKHT